MIRWPGSVIVKVCPPNHLQEYFTPMRERNHVGYFATTSGSSSVKIVTNYLPNQLRAIENMTERWKLPVRFLCCSYRLHTGWSKLTYLTRSFLWSLQEFMLAASFLSNANVLWSVTINIFSVRVQKIKHERIAFGNKLHHTRNS